jgi:hypothetical protein
MCRDGKFRWGDVCSHASRRNVILMLSKVTSEGDFFDAAMNTGLFDCLECRGLSLCEISLNAAFGESPAPTSRLYQQEFDVAFADAVTNGGDLPAFFGLP